MSRDSLVSARRRIEGDTLIDVRLAVHGKQLGDPKKGVEVMLDVIRGEGIAAGRPTPLVLGLGSDTSDTIKKVCDDKLKQLEEWKDVMYSTDFADDK